MVDKAYIFRFLRDLKKNNDKDWMDTHRDRYETAKSRWLYEVEMILERLAKHDSIFEKVTPKKTIERINNNLLYHPDKPTYKHHFGCEPYAATDHQATLYISVGPQRSFIGGGIHNPDKDILANIREAIDENGKAFEKIINSDSIQSYFDGLHKDEKKLKVAPKKYSKNHEHIDLLRRKNFTVMKQLTEAEVVGDNFIDYVEEAYLKMKPLNNFLEKAAGF